MSKPVSFFKEDGKTKPRHEKKKRSSYNGQTRDPSWKRSSINDLTRTRNPHDDPRVQIMESQNFKSWWRRRQQVEPLPKDPFHAYMTDVSLVARQEGYDPWTNEPNRFDIYLDYPPFVPPQTTLQRGRKRTKKKGKRRAPRKKPKPPVKGIFTSRNTSPTRDKFQKEANEFTEKMKVPKVTVVTHENRGYMVSYIKSGWRNKYGQYHPVGTSELHIGTKGNQTLVKSAFLHELGHQVDRQRAYQEKGYLTETDFRKTKKIKTEAEINAWKIADPYLKHPSQKWQKRVALESYMRKGRITFVDVKPV